MYIPKIPNEKSKRRSKCMTMHWFPVIIFVLVWENIIYFLALTSGLYIILFHIKKKKTIAWLIIYLLFRLNLGSNLLVHKHMLFVMVCCGYIYIYIYSTNLINNHKHLSPVAHKFFLFHARCEFDFFYNTKNNYISIFFFDKT